MSYTAGIDDDEIGVFGWFALMKSELFEQFVNLLCFVLIDFAAKSIYGKSFHNMIQCTNVRVRLQG